MNARLDHLVFGVASLPEGITAFAERAGATLPIGGQHPLMGTHNALTRIAPGQFIELIAIDPEADAPTRSRWFSLDAPDTQHRLSHGPALLTWVVAVSDIDRAVDTVHRCGIDPGRIVEQRRGELSWRITVRDDGALVEDGVFPALIEWPVDATARMTDVGVRLNGLRLSHPRPDRLADALAAIGAHGLAELERGPAELIARLHTRSGPPSVWSSRATDP